ncbi:TetR/AcrR family transcriptional regulator [Saccharothrix sp. ALI-22-I]|uniref:TetR/AcrR family transcriptional regulator n=1 Tax=Saccharothrix sp. ALI-22-I TaxID=1933778 RepID=UPI0019310A91|nr:TetR/AcrR family transcriptional regulator [Saccharothrix sp. ALI-22-I]
MALRLIDAEGVDALTMRKLAAALDANPMSLYHHVPNKEALLHGVATLAAAEFRTTAEDLPWRDRLRRLATDFRTLAHRHPNLMAYSSRQPDFIHPEDPFWVGLTEALEAARVPPRDLPQVRALLCAVFNGLLLAELNGALERWVSLPPTPTALDEDLPAAPGTDMGHLFHLAVDAAITSVAQHFTPIPADPEDGDAR